MKHTDRKIMNKVIDRGKELMKSSVDEVHDYSHIAEVERIALEVFRELSKQKYQDISAVTEDLVRATAWWHDCYKARTAHFSLSVLFNEGKESRAIVEKELSNMLSTDDMHMMTDAIEHHAGWSLFPYFFLNRPRSALHKTLIEADAYDLINIGRVQQFVDSNPPIGKKLWAFVDIFLESITLPLYLRTKTTRKNLFKRLKKYWGLWLWDEWNVVKMFLPAKKI